jgi:hypothetical protein
MKITAFGPTRARWSGSIRAGLLGVVIATATAVAAGDARAQDEESPPRIDGQIAVPIEIGMRTVNAEVQCNPRRMLLPPGDLFELNIVNTAKRPIMFVAPEFFEAAEVIDATDVVFDAALGGVWVTPESREEIVFRTPPPGEYGYACYERLEQPTLESTGFLVVAPPAD